MKTIKHTFPKNSDIEFYRVLRDRVNSYFKTNNKTTHGTWNMALKTIVMFSLLFVPYFVMLFSGMTAPWLILLMWFLMGLGKAGIGLNIMHDANHGSLSSKKWVNKMLGESINILGGNAEIWKMQHNVLHHTYTNIENADDDISAPFLLRFSPHTKWNVFHKYQFLYFWILYGLSTISWATSKEFVQLVRYRKLRLIKTKADLRRLLTKLIGWKVVYWVYILVVPILVMPVSIWLVLLGFLVMHFTTGLVLTMIFQTAHVMPECEFPVPDDKGELENTWAVHEMLTTANFGPKSRIFSWCIGGLNYQIEHHLFPKICHVHYKSLSKIVRQTARDFNIPYNSQRTFLTAMWGHIRLLYQLGRMKPEPVRA